MNRVRIWPASPIVLGTHGRSGIQRLLADKKTMRGIGGQVFSKLPATDNVDVITLAIQRRVTVKGLSTLSYSAQPWQSFFPARSAIVEACKNALDSFVATGEPFHYPDLVEGV